MNLPPKIDPARHALFLDFDGTLVELVDRPEDVRIAPVAVERLAALQVECGGAFAMLSGRRIEDLDRFLSPLRFAAGGVHGLERREDPDGPVTALAGPAGLDAIRLILSIGVTEEPRLRLEDKGTSLVLHYRGHPELEQAAIELMTRAVQDEPGYATMKGDNIVEVHLGGMDKGKALAAFMTREPFVGRVPVFVGDDTTDEFAFAAAKELNGVTVKVGSGETSADYRLACVDSVHRWLGVGDTADASDLKEAS